MEKQLRQDENSNCIKVVLYGPESTYKSRLAKQLADYYSTVYVSEFSRVYAEKKAEQHKQLTKKDVLPIAIGQMKSEKQQTKKANKLLICDTDLLETKVYSEYYYDGFCPKIVSQAAIENTYDMYILTDIDTQWEADGIRDRPKDRRSIFGKFEQALIQYNKPYIKVSGSFERRLKTCIRQIDKLLNLKT